VTGPKPCGPETVAFSKHLWAVPLGWSTEQETTRPFDGMCWVRPTAETATQATFATAFNAE
jgi:hypothetical protein